MRPLALLTLLTAASLAAPSSLHAHGGQYRGPGDTVPLGGSGGTSAPGAGGVSGPTGPGGSTPTTGVPGRVGPGGPGSSPSSGTASGGPDGGLDLSQWSFWWEFNKDPFLDLKRSVHSAATVTGSDAWFLGNGEKIQSRDSLRPTEAQVRDSIAPALLAALEGETNSDVVTGCLIALAKIGDPPEESGDSPIGLRLASYLSSPNQEISETAAVALGILGNPTRIELLGSLLDDTPQGRASVARHEVPLRTRAFAAYALGLVGARCTREEDRKVIVQRLRAHLETRDQRARDLPVACVIALGLTPLATLEAPAGAPPEAGRTAQVEYLLSFLADESQPELVRAHVPTALARLIAPELPRSLGEALRTRVGSALLELVAERSKASAPIQQSATLALGLIGSNDLAAPLDRSTIEALIRLAADGEVQTRLFALMSLARVGGRTRPDAQDAEGGTERVAKALLRVLAEGKGQAPSWAALACGVLARSLASDGVQSSRIAGLQVAVRTALREERSAERIGALAVAAGVMRDLEAAPELLLRLSSVREEDARGYVALGLGLMNARNALEPIQAIVAEARFRPGLLKQSAIALGLLGDKNAVGVLAEQLADAKGLATQASLSMALGFIGDRRSVEPLVAMLRSKEVTERARGFAAAALGIVADQAPLPWNATLSCDQNYLAATPTLTHAGSGTGILDLL